MVSVCRKTFSNAGDCPGILNNRKLWLLTDNLDVDAFIDGNFNVYVTAGLIEKSGNDDEVASSCSRILSSLVWSRF